MFFHNSKFYLAFFHTCLLGSILWTFLKFHCVHFFHHSQSQPLRTIPEIISFVFNCAWKECFTRYFCSVLGGTYLWYAYYLALNMVIFKYFSLLLLLLILHLRDPCVDDGEDKEISKWVSSCFIQNTDYQTKGDFSLSMKN